VTSGNRKDPFVPSAKYQLLIDLDGTIQEIRHWLSPKVELTLDHLQLLAAAAEGKFVNIDKAVPAHLEQLDLDEVRQRELLGFIRGITRVKRLERGEAQPVPEVDRSPYADTEIPDGALTLRPPLSFRFVGPMLEMVCHDGTCLPPLDVVEFHALARLANRPLIEDAHRSHADQAGSAAISLDHFREVLRPFVAKGLITAQVERTSRSGVDLSNNVLRGNSTKLILDKFRQHGLDQDEAERARIEAGGEARPKVIPVAFDMCPPAGLGALWAYAKVHEDGVLEEFYDFRTDWVWDEDRMAEFTKEPAIYLFSNYLWSHKRCIDVSERLKQLSPDSIMIHGGPDTPKYLGDQKRYFKDYPSVDVAIRGEGELSCADALDKLRQVIGNEKPDLSVLEGVEGVTYRTETGIKVNEDRGRITDLDVLPSPYLTGLFDTYIGVDDLFVIFETNRGCPYGCTFCDWGSATASRIRKFDIDRVMGELQWASDSQVASISIADANYGVFARDVDIARRAAELKTTTGFPRGFGGNYAKNTVKHLKQIIEVLADGGILTLGTLSLQSMDEETLDAIHRSNIKTEKYDAIAVEMSKSDLPLMIELMMGLPGSSVESFGQDLQQCIDRELPARVNMTTLLVNSPMNDPEYLEEHKIETKEPVAPGSLALLSATATYTEDDLTTMNKIRDVFMLFENYGVMRLVSRFIRQETDVDEMGFYRQMMIDAEDHQMWPSLHMLTTYVTSSMAPPVSWSLVMDELSVYIQKTYGLADSPALRSVLAAQLASLPAHGRAYPETSEFECDVVAWYRAMVVAKEGGDRLEWEQQLPRLETYGPGQVVVDDPYGVTETSLGMNSELNSFGINWELDSPLHRARADLN